MCGIFGILQHTMATVPDRGQLERTAERLGHRGPDHHAEFADFGIGLVHTRLSLVDLGPRSHQPFWDREGRYSLVYNGEIYNFRELRVELARDGTEFRTTSDTEVLLEWLIHRGVDQTLPRLEGMFAFALYDAREGSLVLARDRFGIKPLYVYDQDDAFVFASEVRAMRDWIPFEPDLVSISSYLQGGGGPVSGSSFYRNVRIVQPGTIIEVARGRRGHHRRFWAMHHFWDPGESDRLRALKPGRLVDEAEALLVESVRKQLLADAPVGVLCSGGVDSSVITAIAARSHRDLAVFHADCVGPGSEREAAEALAKHLKVDLKAVAVTDQDSIATLPEVMSHYGHPFTYHPNSIPFLMVSHLVRANGVKAILSGEGADESFIGYPWLIFNVRAFALRLPRQIPGVAYNLLRGRVDRAFRPPVKGAGQPSTTLVQALHDRFETGTESEEIRAEMGRANGRKPAAKDLVTLDQLTYHLRTLLHRNDALGMAASIEARFPFLDTGLVRLAVNMPYAAKVRFSPTTLERKHYLLRDKWVLRKVAERYIPPSLARRKKIGFPVSAPKRFRIAPGFFEDSYVNDLFGLDRRGVRFMAAHADPTLKLKLLHLDVWARVCLVGAPLDEVRARLQEHVALA